MVGMGVVITQKSKLGVLCEWGHTIRALTVLSIGHKGRFQSVVGGASSLLGP